LNHGSYGASPKPVFKSYQKYQTELEIHPVKFMQEDVYRLLEISRKSLSDYINCDKDDLIYEL
jgi:isopenicillin-N epimerase